jgi:hypothetical protein
VLSRAQVLMSRALIRLFDAARSMHGTCLYRHS